jgi:plastocyanin
MEEREMQARKGPDGGVLPPLRGLLLPTFLLVGLASAATAAGDDGRGLATATSADAMVTATAMNTFDPATVTIGQGERVTWTNVGGGEHNVVFDDGSFTAPPTPSTDNWMVSRSFATAGSFTYYCARHPFMRGTVAVNPGAPPPGEPPPPTPGPPPPGDEPPAPGPEGKAQTTITLRISDVTPTRRQRVRFFGSVRPERDGRVVQLQRRGRGGSFRTVTRIRLRNAGTSRSTYSKRLRVLSDAVFRARLPSDAGHLAGTSRTRRVNVR